MMKRQQGGRVFSPARQGKKPWTWITPSGKSKSRPLPAARTQPLIRVDRSAVNECALFQRCRAQKGQRHNPPVERRTAEQTNPTYPRSRIVLLLLRNVFLSIPLRLNLCLVGGIQHVVIYPRWATRCGGAKRPLVRQCIGTNRALGSLVCAARVSGVYVPRSPEVSAFVTGRDRRPASACCR